MLLISVFFFRGGENWKNGRNLPETILIVFSLGDVIPSTFRKLRAFSTLQFSANNTFDKDISHFEGIRGTGSSNW